MSSKGVALFVVAFALARTLAPAEEREVPDDPPATIEAAQPRSPAPPVVRGGNHSIQVNVDAAGMDIVGDAANEPTLAINPLDPNDIAVCWRQFDSISSNFRQAGHAYSLNGGATWTFPGSLDPGQFRSDPVLDADSTGRFFFYSLSSTTTTEYFVSLDGGVTWSAPRASFGGDKNWMAVDATGGIGDGNVYSIWNSQFTCCAPGTDFARSIDGALTHQGPYAMPSKVKWGTVEVGPDGELYVVGIPTNDTPPHVLLRSSNARDTLVVPSFDLVRSVSLGGATTFGGTPNPGGLLGQVWVATDHSSGPSRGNVYVLGSVAASGGGDPLDVKLSRSEDGGNTWSPALRIHDDPLGSYQWFAAVSVAPTGRIDAIWNDTRIHPSGLESEVHYAYSTDEGRTWSAALPVTPRFNSAVGYPQQNKIGDYYHMISDAEGAGLVYSATFRGGQDVYFLRVGDCNANGTHDGNDVASATSADCNENGIPDECEPIPPCTACDGDGLCEPGESCQSCAADCPPAGCGNGACEPAIGEDCLSCPADCAGVQGGSPAERFCCGDGAGTSPVGCADARCQSNGFQCTTVAACCGDAVCEGLENAGTCEADCFPVDNDLDDTRDILDCAPADPGAFAAPGEILAVRVQGNKQTMTWTTDAPSSGTGTVYDVVRGVVGELPVGSGASEVCHATGLTGTSATVATNPPPGVAWYLLVRGRNVCASGGYGDDSNGDPRISLACDP
jgi:hypothetical protein